MPCFHPRDALLRFDPINKKYKVFFEFNSFDKLGPFDRIVQVPCKKCVGCLDDRAKDWAKRVDLEALQYPGKCYFVTLTYDDEHLPMAPVYSVDDKSGEILEREPLSWVPTLRKDHFKKFIYDLWYKRPHPQSGLRFFGCGEYGSKYARPHYHVVLFNLNLPTIRESSNLNYLDPGFCIPDYKIDLKQFAPDSPYYTSEYIASRWPYGFHSIFPYNYNTGKYVAKYLVKDMKREYYDLIHNDKLFPDIQLPFLHMSRRPGIGGTYFEKNRDKLERFDSVVLSSPQGAFHTSLPGYFDRKLKGEEFDESSFCKWFDRKQSRARSAECFTQQQLAQSDLSLSSFLERAEEIALANSKAKKRLDL